MQKSYVSITGERIALPEWTGYSRLRLDPEAWTPLLTCPITQEFYTDPVLVSQTGNTYDRPAILRWISENDTDPMTNVVLHETTLIPNGLLRTILQRIERVMVAGEESLFFYQFHCLPQFAALQSLSQHPATAATIRVNWPKSHYESSNPYEVLAHRELDQGKCARKRTTLFSAKEFRNTRSEVDLSCEFVCYKKLTTSARRVIGPESKWQIRPDDFARIPPIQLVTLADENDRRALDSRFSQKLCPPSEIEFAMALANPSNLLVCGIFGTPLQTPVITEIGVTVDQGSVEFLTRIQQQPQYHDFPGRSHVCCVIPGINTGAKCFPNFAIKNILGLVTAADPAPPSIDSWSDLATEYSRRLFLHRGLARKLRLLLEPLFCDPYSDNITRRVAAVDNRWQRIAGSETLTRARTKISTKAKEILRSMSRYELPNHDFVKLRALYEFPAILTEGDTYGWDFSFLDLSDIVVRDAEFKFTCFDKCNLRGTKFINCRFDACCFVNADLRECQFIDCAMGRNSENHFHGALRD
jgi:U-box domain/Pentapeptide repeats (8 copies)